MNRPTIFAAALLALPFSHSGCGKKAGSHVPDVAPEAGPEASTPINASAPSRTGTSAEPLAAGPAEIWKEFSGLQAFEHVRKQVEIGPRPAGSAELEKARKLIESALQSYGWQVERQAFTEKTPRGPVKFVNLIGRFRPPDFTTAPTERQRAIVCSHYDTKRFSTISFVGASDGASSAGALIELARVLSFAPALAVQVELAFFDGEEAIVQFTEDDGLYGSRHYASDLHASGRAAQFKLGVLWDMIGDKDFNITLSPDSPKDLAGGIFSAAAALGARERFAYWDREIYDDHVPLNKIARIPTIDLIDFDYLYWHTADDTLERIGPEGLEITGRVTLYHLRKALK